MSRVALFLVSTVFLSGASLLAAVQFSVSATAPTVCPGTVNASIGPLQFASAAGGSVSAGSSITISIHPAVVTGSPALEGAPPDVTFAASGSTITIGFPGSVGVRGGTIVTVTGLVANMPPIEGPLRASLSSASDIQLSANSVVIATLVSAGCPGRIATSVPSLEFNAFVGINPFPQSFTVSNSLSPGANMGTFAGAIATPIGWLKAQAGAESGGVSNVTVTVDVIGLVQGTYVGLVIVSSPAADNSPVNVRVTLKVGKGARIDASPARLVFVAEPGKNPPPQNLFVTNGGTGNLAEEIGALTNSGAWLSAARPPNAVPTLYEVIVLSAGLPVGGYGGAVIITSDQAFNSPQLIPVELTVRPAAPTIALSTTTLTFAAFTGENPAPQTFVVNNSDIGTLAWAASVSLEARDWLTVSPTSGTAPTTATVTVNAARLPTGTYEATILITSGSQGITNSPQSIALSLTVWPPGPVIALAPATLTFVADQGRNPAPQSFTITNSSIGTLTWTATATTVTGGDWLAPIPSSGTAPTTVQVNVSSSGLSTGAYSGTITISSPGVINSPQKIPVPLTVRSAAPVITLSALSLTFSALLGGSAPPLTLSLTNTGGGTLAWAATVSTVSGGNWLSVTPVAGTAPATLTVTADSSRLPIGRYLGTISIRSTEIAARNTPQTITVELVVELPRLNSGGIINAASGGTNGLAPGALITIFGSNLAGATRSAGPGDLLPDELGGTVVRIGPFRARLLYVSPTQINAQVPVELTDATAAVRVLVGAQESAAVTLNTLPFDPGLFTTTGQPGGPAAGLRASDFGAISAASPAQRGSVIILYATGLGPVTPSVSSGQFGASREPLNRTVVTPEVRIGDRPARVLFSGLAPNFVGLYQVNAEIPADVPTGENVPLVLAIGGRGSNAARLAIR